MKVTFLGTGTSCGVPLPLCNCEVCRSSDPRDNRLRCSVMVETDDAKQILIDCGPDFRFQALRSGIRRIDALLVTHNHFDHVFGLDDLRAFCFEKALPTYADEIVSHTFRERNDYIFVHKYPGVPKMDLFTVLPDEVLTIGDTEVRPIRVMHGRMPIYGWRIGRLAYITDCTEVLDTEWEKLRGIDTLIIDALRWTPHPTHYSVEQALEVVRRINPRETWFTHMSHEMGLHAEADARLPEHVHLAFDNLVIEL
ncbi:MAG: MBL fold metallo-hydrolase [Bacteroidales bacterium]|nr:MBL fold metallo-hydrolase [Candidatus Liminaster caballi]